MPTKMFNFIYFLLDMNKNGINYIVCIISIKHKIHRKLMKLLIS